MSIREELKHLQTRPRDLRKFAFLVGGVFLLLGLWFFFRHKPWHPWFWIPGMALIGFGALAPTALKPVYLGWMALAFMLGLVVSTVLLTLFFYLVITPIGLLARLLGKDFLARKWSNASSYWLIRPAAGPKNPGEYEQQF
jgi:Na+/glutamate symporter